MMPASTPPRSGCYSCSSESPLIPQMLSELAFNKEVNVPSSPTHPSYTPQNHHQLNKEPQQPSFWNGLFCFSFEDPDMFYDAEEILPQVDAHGRHMLTAEELALLQSMRGGHHQFDELHIPAPNRLGSRGSSRRISSGSQNAAAATAAQNLPDSSASSHFNSATPAVYVTSPHKTINVDTKKMIHPVNHNSDNRHALSKSCTHRTDSTASMSTSSSSLNSHDKEQFGGIPAPPAPQELPLRFLRAGKNDPKEGRRRYEATLQWRKEHGIDTILLEAHPNFELIKEHYPHYYHLKGHHGEPVFFEQPPKTNLHALKKGGIDLHNLVRHYTMVTEFQWQFIERDDLARSITVLDLEGMGMRDFVGECVEYVKMCSQFTGQHYPERAGHVIVVNVPRWFSMIWNVVKPMVDEVTLKKISIVRGKEQVFEALAAKIPVENIPPEYGGNSMPLGQSPEEEAMRQLMEHNNALANGDYSCGGCQNNCRFCSWGPVRSY